MMKLNLSHNIHHDFVKSECLAGTFCLVSMVGKDRYCSRALPTSGR